MNGETPMRTLRTTISAAAILAFLPAIAAAQGPTVKRMLEFTPTLKGVEYETPTDSALEACKVEPVLNAQKKPIGWALRDGQGKLLRRFVVTNKSKQMDQWSYYQDGFEVYRESDLNNDAVPDECRWLNGGGTRVAIVTQSEGGRLGVKAWKRISAEEASKVIVQGLATNDLGLIESVLVTPEELAELGIPKVDVEQVTSAATKRKEAVDALRKSLTGWNKTTVWSRFDCAMPHTIPSDSTTGPPRDLIMYENAIIFAGPPTVSAATANLKFAFLQAPEMVQVGDAWKFIDLPRADRPGEAGDGGRGPTPRCALPTAVWTCRRKCRSRGPAAGACGV